MGACESKTNNNAGVESINGPATSGPVDSPVDTNITPNQVSIQQASDNRESFVYFIKNASKGNDTPECKELRTFLARCFVDCDTDFDGLIGIQDFDKLVERAGALPRKWGFAPTTDEMFANEAAKVAFRKVTFAQIDTSGAGTFAIDEWLAWSMRHVQVKSQYVNYNTAVTKMSTNKEDFKNFIIAACTTRHCPEYKELYHFLQDCFMNADNDNTGFINAEKFDKMVEAAADAPRKFGFAPPTNETYKSDEARKKARTAMFEEIAAKNKRGYTDKISFNAWLVWAYEHICAKAAKLDPKLSGKPPAMDDLTDASYGGAKARAKIGAHRGISVELASNDKNMFIKFIKNAAESKESPEYEELRYFLMECFVECDLDFDGLIEKKDFDNLVERAGSLPRKWGFAPTTLESYKTPEALAQFREKTFKEINTSGSGTIHFDEWLEWSYQHICGKAATLDEKSQSKMETNADDFKKWVINAAKSRESPEFKELYHFLHTCFMKADASGNATGLIDAGQFDQMVELAAQAPRRFGFAPPTNKTYKTDEDRIKARTEMFAQIASKNRRGFRDRISFNAWLIWAYAHICAKAKVLDPSLTGVPPGQQPETNTNPSKPSQASKKK